MQLGLCLFFPVATHVAACLLFMNACKATSAVANGMRTLPCASLNNAFGRSSQTFKANSGFQGDWAQCGPGAPWILAPILKCCPLVHLALREAVL